MGLQLITPATVFPVTVGQAKVLSRVTSSSEDTLFASLIKAATGQIERELGLSIAAQTWKLTLDAFSDAIELPMGPVTSIDAVEYVDENGLTQDVDAGVYSSDLSGSRQWLVLNGGESWPAILDAVNAVSITYTAGMTLTQDHPLGMAILFLVDHLYNRSGESVPAIVKHFMDSYRPVLI